jgi:hypothetical protein
MAPSGKSAPTALPTLAAVSGSPTGRSGRGELAAVFPGRRAQFVGQPLERARAVLALGCEHVEGAASGASELLNPG